MAAEIVVKPRRLDEFASRFAEEVKLKLSGVRPERPLYVDSFIQEERIDAAWFSQYQKLAPFGYGFPEPLFMIRGACIEGAPQVVGEKHLRFTLVWRNQRIQAIAFHFSIDQLPAGSLDVAGRIEEHRWRGKVSLQMQVVAVKPEIRDLI